jgi:hypothetical protein
VQRSVEVKGGLGGYVAMWVVCGNRCSLKYGLEGGGLGDEVSIGVIAYWMVGIGV